MVAQLTSASDFSRAFGSDKPESGIASLLLYLQINLNFFMCGMYSDLCNEPAFIKDLTTAAPTTRPLATTMALAATTKSKMPPQVDSTSAARHIEKDTKAGKSEQLSDEDGDGGDATAIRPQYFLIFISLLVRTWLNIVVTGE